MREYEILSLKFTANPWLKCNKAGDTVVPAYKLIQFQLPDFLSSAWEAFLQHNFTVLA